MIKRTLGQIAQMVDGILSDESYKDTMIEGVSTDSRTIEEGSLYIPLIGEVFDGRIFIKECEDKGAVAFLIDNDYEIKKNISIPYIRVANTEDALRDLARAYRNELKCKVIAITGSNGKTTTKDLLAEVLSEKCLVQKTMGNLNNEIGVPKTILDLNDETEVAIIELGTDNFGDIALTSPIAKPDVAIILNIGDSHLHNLKTKEGIAKAKMEILDGLTEDGTFIYNIDDEILREIVPTYDIKQNVLSFGTDPKADFSIKEVPYDGHGVKFAHGEDEYIINLLGSHNIYNGAAAVMVAELFGMIKYEIDTGLQQSVASHNRSELIELDGFDILDDSYKSNPQALRAGLKTTYALGGYSQKIVVLADMLELGEDEERLHYNLGRQINPAEVHYCLFYGPLAKKMYEGASGHFPADRVFHFDSKADLCDKLKQLITKYTLVFVKGSHGMHLEEVIECIRTLKV